MKKILTILSFLLLTVTAFSQFPSTQFLGTATTLVEARGGFKADSGLIIGNFTDTATANVGSVIKNIAGIEIRTGNIRWYRNSTATAWIQYITQVNNGLSLNAGIAQLGQTISATGNPARFTSDREIDIDSNRLFLRHANLTIENDKGIGVTDDEYPLIVRNTKPGSVNVALFEADVLQLNLRSTAASSTGFATVAFFDGASFIGAIGLDAPSHKIAMVDVRQGASATWEAEGQTMGGMFNYVVGSPTQRGNFFFGNPGGSNFDTHEKVQIYGALKVTDTLKYYKSLPANTSTDSVLMRDANDVVRVIAPSSLVTAIPTLLQVTTAGNTTTKNIAISSINTTQTTTSSALVVNLNSLTSGTGEYLASSTLSTGKMVDIQVSGTAIDNQATGINVLMAGTGNGGAITYAGKFFNTTASNVINNAIYLKAANATNNFALVSDAGSVSITMSGDEQFQLQTNTSNAFPFILQNTSSGGGGVLQLQVASGDGDDIAEFDQGSTSRFAFGGNGTFTVSGSKGTAGQVLQSNGTGAAAGWSNYNPTYNAQTGTSYTLVSTDAGKIITLNNASAITLTVPASLPTGFTCTIIQLGAGQVTFTASSTTIHNKGGFTKTAGQYAVAAITMYAANTFVTGGDMQ